MDLNRMTDIIKANPNFHKAGMIATHLGIVRSLSGDGKAVSALDVEFDNNKLKDIIRDIKSRPGIVDILIETNSGHLAVGDDIVTIMVAGDTRDTVFPALIDAVNRLKTEAAAEKEEVITV